MKPHWLYLKYVLRHKWFVFIAGLRFRAPIWRLIIHDWTKFLPSEWFAYVRNFYGEKLTDDQIMELWRREQVVLGYRVTQSNMQKRSAFDKAWLLHQRRNKHHWQYWYLINDTDGEYPLLMPVKYVREMVADWAGAGRAITGKWEYVVWYVKHGDKMKLHPDTRAIVERVMGLNLENPQPIRERERA